MLKTSSIDKIVSNSIQYFLKLSSRVKPEITQAKDLTDAVSVNFSGPYDFSTMGIVRRILHNDFFLNHVLL